MDLIYQKAIKKLIKKYIETIETNKIKLPPYIFPSYFIFPSYGVLSREYLGNPVNEKAFKFL